jgi:hypothetical protein
MPIDKIPPSEPLGSARPTPGILCTASIVGHLSSTDRLRRSPHSPSAANDGGYPAERA